MLDRYREHAAEREAQGIAPKPLNDADVNSLVALLKDPPTGEEEFSLCCAGLKGAVTSKRSHLCIIDDAIKSADDIKNRDIRVAMEDNWNSVIVPTMFEGGRAICLGTRFRHDDIHQTTFIPDNDWVQIIQSAVTVDSGATLEGIGTSGTVTNNGTVAPGNSIGTLNIAGNYTQGGSSTLNIEVDTSGNTDKLIISGTAALDGTLRITPSSGSYSSQTFNFLTAGSISGTFSSVVATNCTAPSVTYGSTSLNFTLTCSSSNSTNFDNLTSYFNDLSASGDLSTVVSTINGLSLLIYSRVNILWPPTATGRAVRLPAI